MISKSNFSKNPRVRRKLRHQRIRKRIYGDAKIPRLTVFRSNKHLYVQLVDDVRGRTLASFSDLKLSQHKTKNSGTKKMSKVAKAMEVGVGIAKAAIPQKIKKVVYDRGGYKYHGRIKALAEGAQKGGLIF